MQKAIALYAIRQNILERVTLFYKICINFAYYHTFISQKER